MTEFPVPARWLVDKNQDIISRSETCLRHTAREPPNLPMTIPLRSACGPIESQVQVSFSRRLDKMSCISMTSMVSSQSYSFSAFCYERCFVGKECRAFYILHTFWIQTLRAGTEVSPRRGSPDTQTLRTHRDLSVIALLHVPICRIYHAISSPAKAGTLSSFTPIWEWRLAAARENRKQTAHKLNGLGNRWPRPVTRSA